MRRRNGWVFIDAVTAMILLAIAATLLVVAVNRQRRGLDRLDQTRSAFRVAESAMSALQSGRSPSPDFPVHVTLLSTASPSPDMHWIDLTAQVDGRSAHLIGLVPTTAPNPGANP